MCRLSCRVIALCALIALVVSAGVALAANPQLPSARQIIDRHIEAVGGRDAIMAHTSSYALGSIEVVGQGLTGSVEIQAAAPNRTVLTVAFPAAGFETHTGYDGEVGWAMDPISGERILAGAELQQLVDEADYYSDLHEDSKFSAMETVEELEFDGRPAYKVRLVYQSGRETFEYFDVDTGMLIGVEGMQESQMGAMSVVTSVGNYVQMGDLMVPTLLIQDVGGMQTVRTTIDSVEFDSVDESVFELPDAIKAIRR